MKIHPSVLIAQTTIRVNQKTFFLGKWFEHLHQYTLAAVGSLVYKMKLNQLLFFYRGVELWMSVVL